MKLVSWKARPSWRAGCAGRGRIGRTEDRQHHRADHGGRTLHVVEQIVVGRIAVTGRPTGWSWSAPGWAAWPARCTWPRPAGRSPSSSGRPVPGGRAGRLSLDGYEFDTGPTVLTMPSLIEEPLAAVGEKLSDWLELTPLDPAYRAYYPDGSTLDVRTDTVRMAAEISRVCGPREADGYLRFVDFARGCGGSNATTSSTATSTPRSTCSTSTCSSCSAWAASAGCTPRSTVLPRPAHPADLLVPGHVRRARPHDALAIYAVIAYLDSVAGVFFPKGGMHAVPRALAGAAEKHGVEFRYDTTVTRVETSAAGPPG
jgi:phytoene desaturase